MWMRSRAREGGGGGGGGGGEGGREGRAEHNTPGLT